MKSFLATHLPDGILATVGKTPLVSLKKLFPGTGVKLYGKSEYLNPGGSIKDRTALNMLTTALAEGKLRRGDTVIESSSGNMAIGLAQACLYFGLRLIVVVDPKLNKQTESILRTYGARIEYVRKPDKVGGYLSARLNRVKELLKSTPRSFWTNQYSNPDNPRTHEQTMAEIADELNGKVDYIFVATSTCGTLMGCAEYVHRNGLTTRVIGVDAVGSVIFGTPEGERLIPGHGAGRPSAFLKKDRIAEAIHITDEECIAGCHQLLRREALLCGGSSGAIVSAFEKYLPRIPRGAVCVLMLCDRGERYLDTIYNEGWVAQHFPRQSSELQRA
ncbi:2,3-diaminopropionate biosynthesis protein SbnA [Flavilitoribacter nigricans]|uniref:N-(2-amino-2-carboxyethyl)-L-glutamate synthase n=1 Tax=Flavilitoribacter nigricans (strain ATCC 23147 / DSM 23189 / NBRC 102662 / NCIMB 1420 / SS-2) TaxID=1122177 RepID=A0A2D0NB49_FLAN2|nr:2,3-diaminopropionate biosynthesis protein SbnA [Flavilitoribacter nigricans]PHN05715.1 2,3-diaminopropionate biosynthesis protein SbnA [Flavilitoribacter nigricans DSM 23189 = NBRC 102662]